MAATHDEVTVKDENVLNTHRDSLGTLSKNRSNKTREERDREEDARRKANFIKFLRKPGNMRTDEEIAEQMEQMKE